MLENKLVHSWSEFEYYYKGQYVITLICYFAYQWKSLLYEMYFFQYSVLFQRFKLNLKYNPHYVSLSKSHVTCTQTPKQNKMFISLQLFQVIQNYLTGKFCWHILNIMNIK